MWNDKEINIKWPKIDGIQEYLTSEKDSKWPTLNELRSEGLFQEYRIEKK